MRQPILTTIVAACLLASCATNPLIPINAPGLAVKPTADGAAIADPGQPMSLSKARNFSLNVRAEYREQMRKQIDESQMLNSGLLLLGASVIGLAAGGVRHTGTRQRRDGRPPPQTAVESRFRGHRVGTRGPVMFRMPVRLGGSGFFIRDAWKGTDDREAA